MKSVLFLAVALCPGHCAASNGEKCCREMDGLYFWTFASTGPKCLTAVCRATDCSEPVTFDWMVVCLHSGQSGRSPVATLSASFCFNLECLASFRGWWEMVCNYSFVRSCCWTTWKSYSVLMFSRGVCTSACWIVTAKLRRSLWLMEIKKINWTN